MGRLREKYVEGYGTLLNLSTTQNDGQHYQCREKLKAINSRISCVLFVNENSSSARQNDISRDISVLDFNVLIF